MMKTTGVAMWLVAATGGMLVGCGRANVPAEMTFFVTSVAVAEGGNIGGLAAADAHCQRLAEAVGSANRHWRAYLSAAGEMTLLTALDRDVEIVIRPKPRSKRPARISVVAA